MKYLIVDIGNTNIKVAEINNNNVLKISIFQNYIDFQDSYSNEYFLIIASVNDNINQKIISSNYQYYFLNYKNYPKKILVDYPEKVGLDRLANSLYLWEKTRKKGVILDIGTAITLDFIDDEGNFLGGQILPGPDIMIKALNIYTSKLPEIKFSYSDLMIGKNTEEAINIGINSFINSYLDYTVNIVSKNFQTDNIIFTGNFFNKNIFEQYKKNIHLEATILGIFYMAKLNKIGPLKN